MKSNKKSLPQIPNKRYFTIGEVGYLCNVKPHVLRYWEQEFPQLKPAKRRGNRRYYQREDVIMVRNIRGLLYDEGYTISGARIQLDNVIKEQRRANREAQELSKAEQVQAKAQESRHIAKATTNSSATDNTISYSVKFTVGENETETERSDLNSVTGTSRGQGTLRVDSKPTQVQDDRKLKKYKLVIDEVIHELQDILSELNDSSYKVI